ncbi:aminoacyl--tRNA ligase-related protein [Micromonospora sp. NPDC005203]|uniref:aminoacyl--tRNA ligase-related protein n=1 Tax=Micromonospora sp. NPDC005203 TaxID=3364226 RepID=UPI0036C26FD6
MPTLSLPVTLQENLWPTMHTRLRFHFPQIEQLDMTATEIRVHSAAALPAAKVRSVVERVAASYKAISERLSSRVVYDPADGTDAPALSAEDATALRAAAVRLVADLDEARAALPADGLGEVLPRERGINVYGGVGAYRLRAIDDFFRRFFERAHGATEIRVPSMLPATVVDRAGHFDTGCQHLSFVAPMTTDMEDFEGFLPYWRADNDRDRLHEFLRTPRDILNPALCLHAYPLVEHRPVDDLVLTLSGSCFRDESGNLNNRERLREFTMREAVFFGSQTDLARVHQRVVAMMAAVADLLGFKYQLATATDIFFNDNAQEQLFSQLVTDSKIEMLVQVDDGDSIAVASLNKHGQHFAKPFGLSNSDGTTPSTMCIGFGLDRVLLALRDVPDLPGQLRQGLARMERQA